MQRQYHRFFGLDVSQVLGKALDEIIGKQECDKINRHLTEQNPEQFYTLTYRSVCFSTALYQQGELLLLEIERFPDQSWFTKNYHQLRLLSLTMW